MMHEYLALVVEDDEFKRSDIVKAIGVDYKIDHATSVSSAVKAVFDVKYDLMILDMALPTFEKRTKDSGGTSQPQGGIEVLRALRHLGRSTSAIIVSQFPSLEIDGVFYKLEQTPSELSERYGVKLLGAVLYDFETIDWTREFQGLLEQHANTHN